MGEERRESREKCSVHGRLQTFPSLFGITGPDSGCQLRRGMCMRVGPVVGLANQNADMAPYYNSRPIRSQ